MATALKTAIENRVVAAIQDFAGAGSVNVDPDLAATQQLKEITRGYRLLDSDKKKGPLVRVKVMRRPIMQDEVGNGSGGRSLLIKPVLRIEGISAKYRRDIGQACADRDLIEEVILLNLLKHFQEGDVPLLGSFTGGKSSYIEEICYLDAKYEEEELTAEKPAPVIDAPLPAGGNTSTGIISVNPASPYTGKTLAVFTAQIVAGNTGPGSLTGMTWRWKKDSGAYSAPQAATGSYQALSDGVQVKFALAAGQNFVANNSWAIQADPGGTEFVALFAQDWELKGEAVSG